ncbi:MAG: prepilin-type N-terminal cleavage/methylation domain-containing protein [Sulfuricella sp.]|nr:prepilin-type N-terminal cleavage/methylation domain-containing protein [Sulfuricella sp.]
MKMYGRKKSGFTLVEIAIVLVIVGLLLGGLLMPLSTQMDQRRVSDTQQTLNQIQEALLGFSIANGRLPCPATAASGGVEAPVGGGVCTSPWTGFLPAVTLGITPIDNAGFALDGWQTPANRIRYAVTTSNGSAFTTAGGMATTTMAILAPNLNVCTTATGITAVACGAAPALTTNAVAIIYSLGKNAGAGGAGLDEAANLNADPVFVSHPRAEAAAANGEFDDIIVWLSPNTLYNRMVAAGRLP